MEYALERQKKKERKVESKGSEKETINAKYKRAKSFGFFAKKNERHGKNKQTNREKQLLVKHTTSLCPATFTYVSLHILNVS